MPGLKTNEREGTRAVHRNYPMSATKVRQVLDLIRGEDADRATELLALTDREAGLAVGKVLASAVANAVHNDGLDAEELYVAACYADEGATMKRWRPRARGRATRIRKRTTHITVIVGRMPEDRIARRRARSAANASQRSRRVAGSRRRQQAERSPAVERTPVQTTQVEPTEVEAIDVEAIDVEATEVEATEAEATEVEATGTEDAGTEDAETTEGGDEAGDAGGEKGE